MAGWIISENVQGLATQSRTGIPKVKLFGRLVLPPLPCENHPKDIFNADECWMFFSLLPPKICF
jgi:hypothetical protein